MKNTEETDRSNARLEYRQHLRNTLMLAEVVIAGDLLAGCIMGLSLITWAAARGTNFMHPVLALFILVASGLLFIVAFASMIRTRELILKENE